MPIKARGCAAQDAKSTFAIDMTSLSGGQDRR
jgi:hypothetical protein